MSSLAPSHLEVHAPQTAATNLPRISTQHISILLLLWMAIFAASLPNPPLLDDADATHAQAAQAMLRTGDWVTLHVDGVRYLEKAPLPYWIAALSLRIFGQNAFAIHLPVAIAVLGLALLGYAWARRTFDTQTAFYTAFFVLTTAGVFLFTRIFIPDALLSLLLACGLFALHRALEPNAPNVQAEKAAPGTTTTLPFALLFWFSMALAVLTKGLIAIVFLLVTAALFLSVTGRWREWRKLHPVSGGLVLLAVAAPWHILAGLRNTGGANSHGFFWFYFINEHMLRFLDRRIPRDYNKLPDTAYWLLQLVWLAPWSAFAPLAALALWREFRKQTPSITRDSNLLPPVRLQLGFGLLGALCLLAGSGIATAVLISLFSFALLLVVTHRLADGLPWSPFHGLNPRRNAALLLTLFSMVVLIVFAFSTNQEYYTFPAYLPLLLLLAFCLARAERHSLSDMGRRRALALSQSLLSVLGLGVAAALLYGLWSARRYSSSSSIGDLLAHRGFGDYTLSLSHLLDLTGPSFAALRFPASLAALALALGPLLAGTLRRRTRHTAATLTVAATGTVFLIAAHVALLRFAPLLSSYSTADCVLALERSHRIGPDSQVFLLGDQSFGSSIPFYLHRSVQLVDGRSSSMFFGSSFPDVPPVFVSSADLAARWGLGPRKLLFVPAEQRRAADRLLGSRAIVLFQSSGKELLTDRPLDAHGPSQTTNHPAR